jgi:chemotaxis protein methyltransferase CheR
MMYFTPEIMRSVVGRIARSLLPGGFLFLGHAETLRAISHEFHLRHTHETFYYQRRQADENDGDSCCSLSPADSDLPRRMPVPPMESGDSWFSTIQRASERISRLTEGKNELTESVSSSAKTNSPAAQLRMTWDSTRAIDLLRRERFSEAIELLQGLPSEYERDPDTQLLIAVLLTNRGELPQAEEV